MPIRTVRYGQRVLEVMEHGYTTVYRRRGEPWLSPRQHQYPDRKVTDLSALKPFGAVCWTHIKKERRVGKSDGYPRGEQGILVGYDDDQGPLLARVYFPDTRVSVIYGVSEIQGSSDWR
jgi:hypothetical protein